LFRVSGTGPVGQDSGVALALHLCTRAEAERVLARRRDEANDAPWMAGYPLDGDARACLAYISQLALSAGPDASSPFGYYQVLEDGVVVGGIGFHGPPRGQVVEVGYGVAPDARGRGVATRALLSLLEVAARLEGVQRVVGRTEETNVASQRVMLAAGMRLVGRDPDFLHYQIDLPS
jgi:RimJ/RimL family protein N-acetyltransferase